MAHRVIPTAIYKLRPYLRVSICRILRLNMGLLQGHHCNSQILTTRMQCTHPFSLPPSFPMCMHACRYTCPSSPSRRPAPPHTHARHRCHYLTTPVHKRGPTCVRTLSCIPSVLTWTYALALSISPLIAANGRSDGNSTTSGACRNSSRVAACAAGAWLG